MLKESEAAIGWELLMDNCEISVVMCICELQNKPADTSPADPQTDHNF